jgi:uncharacterized membrane protein
MKSLVKVVVFVVVASIAGVWPNVAEANLRFCNRTGATIHLAIASVEKDAPGTSTGGDKGVRTEGWWNVEPNQCEIVSTIDAGNHWVYYYAHSGDSRWAGNALLCITSGRFDTGARFKREGDRCQAGYRLQGFRRIETRAKNHTHNLTPSGN